jgi:hypothetical protein
VFVSGKIGSCSSGTGGGEGGRLMFSGCIVAMSSILAAEDEMDGRTGRDVCQHECSAEKRVESEWHVGRRVQMGRLSMNKSVTLGGGGGEGACDVMVSQCLHSGVSRLRLSPKCVTWTSDSSHDSSRPSSSPDHGVRS